MTVHLITQDRSLEKKSLHCVFEQKREERVDLSLQHLLTSVISLLLLSACMAYLDERAVNRAGISNIPDTVAVMRFSISHLLLSKFYGRRDIHMSW